MTLILAALLVASTTSAIPVQIGDPFSGYSTISADGRVIACRRLAQIEIWDAKSLTLRKTIPIPYTHGSSGFDIRPALSPDGKQVACIPSDCSFVIFDTTSGKVIRSTPAPEKVNGLDLVESTMFRYSPDGKILFVPSISGGLEARSSSGGLLYSQNCAQIAISREQVATMDDDRVEIRDLQNGEERGTIQDQFDSEYPIGLSPDGQFLAAVAAKPNSEGAGPPTLQLTLWSVQSKACLWRKDGPWEFLKKGQIHISKDDKLIDLEGPSEVVVDLSNGKTLQHNEFSKGCRLICAAGSPLVMRQEPQDKIVVTDLETGNHSTVTKAFFECPQIRDLTFSGSGERMIASEMYSLDGLPEDTMMGSGADGDGSRVWDLTANKGKGSIDGFGLGFHFPDDSKVFVTLATGHQVDEKTQGSYSAETGKRLAIVMKVTAKARFDTEWPNPSGSGYLTMSPSDGQTGPFTFHRNGSDAAGLPLEKAFSISPFDCAFSPDGKQLAAYSYPKVADVSQANLDMWDLATGKAKHVDPRGGAKGLSLYRLQFSPDSSLIVSLVEVQDGAQKLNRFCLWDVHSGAMRCHFDIRTTVGTHVAVSPKNDQIAIGTSTGFCFYSASNGAIQQGFNIGEGAEVLGYARDGSAVFTTPCFNPGPIQKWRVADGKFLGSFWGLTHNKKISPEWISVDEDCKYRSSAAVAALLSNKDVR